MDLEQLREFMLKESHNQHGKNFHVAQCTLTRPACLSSPSGILTPTPKTIAGTFVPYNSSNIADLSKLVSPHLCEWLQSHLTPQNDGETCTLPNIVICDYYHTFDFVEIIKEINEVRFGKKDKEIKDSDGSWALM
jgi:hypothetical protein